MAVSPVRELFRVIEMMREPASAVKDELGTTPHAQAGHSSCTSVSVLVSTSVIIALSAMAQALLWRQFASTRHMETSRLTSPRRDRGAPAEGGDEDPYADPEVSGIFLSPMARPPPSTPPLDSPSHTPTRECA